jgi:hypothetical protein
LFRGLLTSERITLRPKVRPLLEPLMRVADTILILEVGSASVAV